jgi:hypothetical protein
LPHLPSAKIPSLPKIFKEFKTFLLFGVSMSEIGKQEISEQFLKKIREFLEVSLKRELDKKLEIFEFFL